MNTLLAVLFLTQTVQFTQEVPDRVITDHGVELRSDEASFLLFASLNALGYAKETRRLGPPLHAPVFDPTRVRVRKHMETHVKQGHLDHLRILFDKKPAEISVYLSALHGPEQGQESPIHKALARVRKSARLEALFGEIVSTTHDESARLKRALDHDFEEAKKRYDLSELRGPKSFAFVLNALDGHGIVHRVQTGKGTLLIMGPGPNALRTRILAESLQPSLERFTALFFSNAAGYKRSWKKLGSKISQRYKNKGSVYLAEAVSRAAAHRVVTKKSREADEAFIERQIREGLLWSASALRIVDAHRYGKSIRHTLPQLAGRHTP